MIVWLMFTVGQWPFRRVNVTYDHLDSLNLIFHFCSHFSTRCKCSWSSSEAILMSSWVGNIAVSSANVPNLVSLDVGKSDVYSTYRRGPSMLPWGTPEWIWKRLEVSPSNFFRTGVHLGTISAGWNSLTVRFFWLWIVTLGAILYQMPDLCLQILLYNIVGFP